jgi:hypothetical protein
MKLLLIAIVLVESFFAQQKSQRAFPDNNLGYPVLISIAGGSASGFYYNTGKSIYLVTAAHVLYPVENKLWTLRSNKIDLLSYSDASDQLADRMEIDAQKLGDANFIHHATADVAVVKLFDVIGSASSRPLPGVRWQQNSKQGLVTANPEAVAKMEDVLIGDDVFVFGYPISIGLKEGLQFDPERPLLHKGIVAGINRFQHSVIIDCPAYPGNSGGPVIEADTVDSITRRFRVIGVMDQMIPYDGRDRAMGVMNSGYSVIVPMDYVLELVEGK